MPKSKKIIVSWQIIKDEAIDFGMFLAHKNHQIQVDADLWEKYLTLRLEFENLHFELLDKIKNSRVFCT